MDEKDGHLGCEPDSSASSGVPIRVECFDIFFDSITPWIDGMFFVQTRLDSTVGAFKTALAQRCNTPADELHQIIYNNQPLNDNRTLESYGLELADQSNQREMTIREGFVVFVTILFEVMKLFDVLLGDVSLSRSRTMLKLFVFLLLRCMILDRDPHIASIVSDPVTLREAFMGPRWEIELNAATGSIENFTGDINGKGPNLISNSTNLATGSGDVSTTSTSGSPDTGSIDEL